MSQLLKALFITGRSLVR